MVRRPPRGIWAGLWCLPEGRDGHARGDADLLLSRRHTLSHLDLDIRLVDAPSGPVLGPDPLPGIWTTASARERLAIPPVVREMLESLPPRVPGKT